MGTRAKIRTVVLGLTIAVLGTTAVTAEAPSYLDHDELVARIRAIAGAHPDIALRPASSSAPAASSIAWIDRPSKLVPISTTDTRSGCAPAMARMRATSAS